MDAFLTFLASIPLLAGVFGMTPAQAPQEAAFSSVEIGLAELSPRGEEGGYAVPASGSSSYVTCTLTVTPNPSTQGQNVALTWSNGQPTMNVYRNGVLISSGRSSGWTDTTASSLAVGSYVYLVQKDVTTTSCSGGRGGTCTNTITTYSCSRTLTVNAPLRPDLVPAAPAVVGADTTRTFTSTVTNSGAAAAGAFANRFEIDLGQNGSVDTTINANGVAALAVSASSNLTSAASWAVQAGNHRVRTMVDTGSAVTESNEANNTSAWTNFSIQPDLTTSNVILNSGTLQVNNAVTFRGTVANSNVVTTGAGFNDQFSYRYGSSGAFTPFSTVAQLMLAAGASANNTSGSVTFASSGAIQIQFCADSGSTVTESNEGNNCTIQSFTVNPAPVPTVNLDIRETGVGGWGDSVTVDFGVDVELQWTSSGADRCVGDSYFSTGGGQPTSGTQGTVSEPSSGSRVYRVTCYDDDAGTSNNDTATVNITPPSGNPSVTANPGRVQQGDPTEVAWDTGGNPNCVITGTNGDVFDLQALYPGQQSGTVTSGSINAETVYTITCDTGTPGSSTVRIFPVFEEI